jgi:hypothetical protein
MDLLHSHLSRNDVGKLEATRKTSDGMRDGFGTRSGSDGDQRRPPQSVERVERNGLPSLASSPARDPNPEGETSRRCITRKFVFALSFPIDDHRI